MPTARLRICRRLATACAAWRHSSRCAGVALKGRDRPLAVERRSYRPAFRQRLGAVQQRQQIPLLADGHPFQRGRVNLRDTVKHQPSPCQSSAASPRAENLRPDLGRAQFLEVAGRPSLDTLHKREMILKFSFKKPRRDSPAPGFLGLRRCIRKVMNKDEFGIRRRKLPVETRQQAIEAVAVLPAAPPLPSPSTARDRKAAPQTCPASPSQPHRQAARPSPHQVF